jgi:hypothetical protein
MSESRPENTEGGTNWIGVWVSFRAALGPLEKKREISCPYRESNYDFSLQIQIVKQANISYSVLYWYEPDLLLNSNDMDWQCQSKWVFRSILIPKRGKIRWMTHWITWSFMNYTVHFPSLNITGPTNENGNQCGLCSEHENYDLTFRTDTV